MNIIFLFFIFSSIVLFNSYEVPPQQINTITKCIYWRSKLRVACGLIFKNTTNPEKTKAESVDWYFTNDKILKSIDRFCDTCNLENELFLFENGHTYEIEYGIVNDQGNIIIKEDSIVELESVQDLECFICFMDLFIFEK